MKKSGAFAVIDCETDPFLVGRVPEPFLWGFYDGKEYRHFPSSEEIADYISDLPLTIFAHNGGKFDFHFLLPWAERKMLVISGRIATMQIGEAELRDSYLVLPRPLREFGSKKAIDISKLEKSNRAEHMEEIIAYNRQDCVGLYEGLEKWRSNHGNAITLAGAALSSMLSIEGLKKPKSKPSYDADCRPWYRGGRVSRFANGHVPGPIQVADIRSAYPWAMATQPHPWGFERSLSTSNIEPKPHGFYKVECFSMAAFPVTIAGRTEYPITRGEYLVTGHELLAAIETKRVRGLRIIEAVEWHQTISFPNFVGHWYAKKAAATNPWDRMEAKLILNSAYGKLAINPEEHKQWMIGTLETIGDLIDKEWAVEREIAPNQFILSCPAEFFHRESYLDVAVAASITGAVRAKWLRGASACSEIGRVIYGDTDSLHVQSSEKLPLDFSEELGAWSHEGTFSDGWYAARKMYALAVDGIPKKVACKGVRLTPDEVRRVALGEKIRWDQAAPSFRLRADPTFVSRRVELDSGTDLW